MSTTTDGGFTASELQLIWNALVKRAEICDGDSHAAWGAVKCAAYAQERDECSELAGRIHGMIQERQQ